MLSLLQSPDAKRLLAAICGTVIQRDTLMVISDDVLARPEVEGLSVAARESALRVLQPIVRVERSADGEPFAFIPNMLAFRMHLQNHAEYESWQRDVAAAIWLKKLTDDAAISDETGIPRRIVQYFFDEFAETGDLKYPGQETRPYGIHSASERLKRYLR